VVTRDYERDEEAESIGHLGQRKYSEGWYNADRYHTYFSKFIECTIPRVNLSVYCRFDSNGVNDNN
jgi:hypothetical protein